MILGTWICDMVFLYKFKFYLIRYEVPCHLGLSTSIVQLMEKESKETMQKISKVVILKISLISFTILQKVQLLCSVPIFSIIIEKQEKVYLLCCDFPNLSKSISMYLKVRPLSFSWISFREILGTKKCKIYTFVLNLVRFWCAIRC